MSVKFKINNQQVKRVYLGEGEDAPRVKKIYIDDKLVFTDSVNIKTTRTRYIKGWPNVCLR